jgi:hypothetical protein
MRANKWEGFLSISHLNYLRQTISLTMKKNTFAFIRNKFFLTGLFSGVVITCVVGLLVISPYFPRPEEDLLKGTMSPVSYTPSVGDIGIVWEADQLWIDGPFYSLVVFDGHPTLPLYCHPEVPGAHVLRARVVVTKVNEGSFSNNGGVFVTVE